MNSSILFAVSSETTSLIVAITILLGIFAIMITAMIKYGIDDTLKIWAALGTLTGLVTGSMATYFFTAKANQAEKAASDERVEKLTAQLATAKTNTDVLSNMAILDGNLGRSNFTTDMILKYASDSKGANAPARFLPEPKPLDPPSLPAVPNKAATPGQ